jgi:hypothetical protein
MYCSDFDIAKTSVSNRPLASLIVSRSPVYVIDFLVASQLKLLICSKITFKQTFDADLGVYVNEPDSFFLTKVNQPKYWPDEPITPAKWMRQIGGWVVSLVAAVAVAMATQFKCDILKLVSLSCT